jgi:hypothetical protein
VRLLLRWGHLRGFPGRLHAAPTRDPMGLDCCYDNLQWISRMSQAGVGARAVCMSAPLACTASITLSTVSAAQWEHRVNGPRRAQRLIDSASKHLHNVERQ